MGGGNFSFFVYRMETWQAQYNEKQKKPLGQTNHISHSTSNTSDKQWTTQKINNVVVSTIDDLTTTLILPKGNTITIKQAPKRSLSNILASTVGRLSSVLTASILTLNPLDGLKNPKKKDLIDILTSPWYRDAKFDENLTVYLGAVPPLEMGKRFYQTIMEEKKLGYFRKPLGLIWWTWIMIQSFFANLSRADHYSPWANAIWSYMGWKYGKAIKAHELGHAEDLRATNNEKARWFWWFFKRFLPITGNLYTERKATNIALNRAEEQDKERMRKVLTPAFGTYVWWAILEIVSLVWLLTTWTSFVKKIPLIWPLSTIWWAILWHIWSRIWWFSSWLFGEKKKETLQK